MRWFMEESKKQTFTFPVNTAVLYVDEKTKKIQDQEFLSLVSELNSYNGSFNIYIGELGKLSSCCRLRNNVTEANAYTNSFGSGGVSIGSHRVVTLNLPRIAFESADEAEYLKRLEYAVLVSQDILQTHRELLQDVIKLGKLPLYSRGYMSLNRQFSTIGFIGMNESCEIIKKDIRTEDGSNFAVKVLNKINELNSVKAKKTGNMWNMEQIPGESAAPMFAEKDKLLFHNSQYDMYSNQYIPLWTNVDVSDRIDLAGKFDSLCSGGAIAHITVTDSLNKDQMQKLIEYSAKQGVIYFAVNMAQCRCKTCGQLFIGQFDKSPCHHAAVDRYLRIVGFLTNVDSSWSKPRRVEYSKRQFYTQEQITTN